MIQRACGFRTLASLFTIMSKLQENAINYIFEKLEFGKYEYAYILALFCKYSSSTLKDAYLNISK